MANFDTDTPAGRLVLEALHDAVSDAALPAHSLLAVALSGGLDSTVLLDAAVRAFGASRIVALHVHHGLSPNADAWVSHCEAFAASLDVRYASRHIDVVRPGGAGLEAAARDARYRALDDLCDEQGAAALLIAHHADDQAETVLLQLLRGAGVAGLAAMAPQRLHAGGAPRLRPLLRLLRAQLEQYAHERDLSWIEDESNADTRYARNALRHDVLPVLAVQFPGFRDALARTASHAASAQRLLDDLAGIDMDRARHAQEGALALDALLVFDDERATNLLRFWMRDRGLQAASTARIADILRQLRAAADSRDGHALRIDHAGHALRVYRNALFWEKADSADAADLDESLNGARTLVELRWQGEEVWRLPQWRGTLVFESVDHAGDDVIAESVLRAAPLSARSRTGGERLRIAPDGPGRTLKNVFQERGVPAWKRDVPLIFVGAALMFVPLVGVNREIESAPGPWRRLVWRPDLLIA